MKTRRVNRPVLQTVAQFPLRKQPAHLQVFYLQGVHVQLYDTAGGAQTVRELNDVAELWLGEELLLCQRPAGTQSRLSCTDQVVKCSLLNRGQQSRSPQPLAMPSAY